MIEKRFTTNNGVFYTDTETGWEFKCYGEVVALMNDLATKCSQLKNENEQLKSLNQELRNELQFDEKVYKTFNEIISEADDLITSHLSKHYQRQWKNFCENREIVLK